jgi:hypothetical protein
MENTDILINIYIGNRPNMNLISQFSKGHYLNIGKSANVYKNPIWEVCENNKKYYIMYCEKNTFIKICDISYKKILDFEKEKNENKKLTWYKLKNGYISCSKSLYLHQIITNCYGNGKGTKNISVDHIDRDPFNNIFDNLRISTRKEQENNSKGIMEGTKKERKHNAKPLPNEITQNMMKKYVVYYHEWLNKEKTRSREFFKIEKHPKLKKIWIGTKSNKISILDKLNQANKMIEEIDEL